MINRLIKPLKNKSFFLFGSRQTGKSTLLRGLFPLETSLYYDLLKTEEYLRLQANPSLLREEVKSRPAKITHVVLDEIQRVPELLNEVHLLMESPNPPHFVLSGSSARKLKRSQANLLGGRALTYRLFPLTVAELGKSFSLNRALRFGTLPKIYLEESEEAAAEQLRSYVETYLKEEIEVEAQVRQLGTFVRFLTIAGIENGNIINFSNIARDTGTTYPVVKSYFQILEDTLIGEMLYPYHNSKRKRLSKHPKFYFFDSGVTRALTRKLTVPLEPKTPEYGRAFEHFLILEIMHRSHYQKNDFTFSYYRTEAGAEVDLIIETPKGTIYAIEIKSGDNVESLHFNGLRSFGEICPEAKLMCAAQVPHQRQMENILILPWEECLNYLQGSRVHDDNGVRHINISSSCPS